MRGIKKKLRKFRKMLSTTKFFLIHNILEHTDFLFQTFVVNELKSPVKTLKKLFQILLPHFIPFIYLKSSEMNADFCYHFRCLKRDERRNQTLVQNIVHKMSFFFYKLL